MAVIDISQFSKNYGSFTAVEDMNLTVERGKIVGFVGKNGAGKSTTIRSMVNVLRPTKGSITISGLDSVKCAKKIKHILSYMPGDAMFYSNVTCMELFKLCLSFSDTEMEKVARLATYFELDLNKRIAELSLGNRKKVSIIQAFIKLGDILVMDEPTSGLDPLMQERFFDLVLKEKTKGTTVFLSSHNLSEIEKYCDEVVIIKDGKIIDILDMSNVKLKRRQVVSYKTKEQKAERFVFEGDVNELIAKLAALDLESVEIKPETIEDEFIKYYKTGDNDA
jgi:ABC-2 type transport system ATP-binding protein